MKLLSLILVLSLLFGGSLSAQSILPVQADTVILNQISSMWADTINIKTGNVICLHGHLMDDSSLVIDNIDKGLESCNPSIDTTVVGVLGFVDGTKLNGNRVMKDMSMLLHKYPQFMFMGVVYDVMIMTEHGLTQKFPLFWCSFKPWKGEEVPYRALT